MYKSVRMAIVLSVFIFFSCSHPGKNDESIPPAPFPEPQTILFQPAEKYRVNVVTGDSILPLKNAKGDLIKTGVPVPMDQRKQDTGFLLPPVSVPAAWKFMDTLKTNRTAIKGKPDTLPLDLSKLPRFVAGVTMPAPASPDKNRDSIVSGKPIPARPEIVPCKRHVLRKMLPMSVQPDARYGMKQLNTYHGLTSSNIFHVMEDNRGNLWFSTMAGLICYDGQYSQTFGKKQGLLADIVFYNLFIQGKFNLDIAVWTHKIS